MGRSTFVPKRELSPRPGRDAMILNQHLHHDSYGMLRLLFVS